MNFEQLKAENEAFIASTQFFDIDEFNKAVAPSDVQLPKHGSYYIIANNEDEVLDFLIKIDPLGLDAWAEQGVIKFNVDPSAGDAAHTEFANESFYSRSGLVVQYNEYFDQPLMLTKNADMLVAKRCAIRLDPDYMETVTFPCMVHHNADSSFDRVA